MIAEVPEFLDIEDVLELHALQLTRYGGADGIRDRGLLESALAQAQGVAQGLVNKATAADTLRRIAQDQ